MNVSFSIFHGCSQYYWPVLVPDLDHIHTCTNARTPSRADRETDRRRESLSGIHTPSHAFRHLPWRKDVANQCLEFAKFCSQKEARWPVGVLALGNNRSSVTGEGTRAHC